MAIGTSNGGGVVQGGKLGFGGEKRTGGGLPEEEEVDSSIRQRCYIMGWVG